MQFAFDVRFWATTIIALAILLVLAPARQLKGRNWLIGSVLLSWVLTAAFYVPALMNRTGLLAADRYREVLAVTGGLSSLIDVASWLLLLVYAVAAKGGAAAAAAERRAAFEHKLAAGAEHDLVDLVEGAVVAVAGSGKDITQVVARARNLTSHPLRVVVAPGTCFTSSGAHQNMVAVESTRFALQPEGSETIVMRASCVNASRPIPGEADQFRGVHRVSPILAKFLQHASGASAMARQAGVWAITDNYSASDVQAHLIAQDSFGNKRSAVSDADIAEARRILDLVGARHRL